MSTIRKKLVPDVLANKVSYGKGNVKKYIVVHETDNTRSGADADAHARLQYNGNSRNASWHYTVDDKEAVQSFEHAWRCWAAGSTTGNNQGIQVEVCVNGDGNYPKAMQNAAELVAKIMKDENIPISNVVQHNYFSGKNCPRNLREGKITWPQFIAMVKNASGNVQQQKPVIDNNKYRVLTGTYATRQAAENVLDVLKHRFGWVAYSEQDGVKWRVKTGTFTGMAAAKAGANKIKGAKLAQETNIITA
ncbi:N-acetylmuramoyl-L-alanine amidase CwlH [Lysinibacillus sphaericus]|uniref:N-acetylmuramoyl-L-alanine amidase n=1 Tax=Lysinibacillus sphaericus TaxID=1421 RepID=A0A2S5D072_LYSSH|nr:N-acetylmuramoyl-L-alanine amidase [Lysinibacillus sphaericus]POZ56451.1 N-acetylmuramoyl-L-alanine amidase CwlH [Lysinibacillus sphaericus]